MDHSPTRASSARINFFGRKREPRFRLVRLDKQFLGLSGERECCAHVRGFHLSNELRLSNKHNINLIFGYGEHDLILNTKYRGTRVIFVFAVVSIYIVTTANSLSVLYICYFFWGVTIILVPLRNRTSRDVLGSHIFLRYYIYSETGKIVLVWHMLITSII